MGVMQVLGEASSRIVSPGCTMDWTFILSMKMFVLLFQSQRYVVPVNFSVVALCFARFADSFPIRSVRVFLDLHHPLVRERHFCF